MKLAIIISILSTVIVLGCSTQLQTSNDYKPDLIIEKVTYYDDSYYGRSIRCTLFIRNIGKASFENRLYLSCAKGQGDIKYNHFSYTVRICVDYIGSVTVPKRIRAGETVIETFSLPLPTPIDPEKNPVNEIIFHLDTDNKSNDPALPICDESNYLNNDYILFLE